LSAPRYEALLYGEADGVATVTLNRPDQYNAFDLTMQRELRDVWRSLRGNDDVRCIILTGAGDKSFCTGIDRGEAMNPDHTWPEDALVGSTGTPFQFDDPGDRIGPKTNDLWKPVIAAVNGMACGGAFYLLGEVEFIIAADHATFFDPHVTYGMTAAFEPIHMAGRMPFGEIMRVSLMGNHERLSAQRAHQVGLVSEVVPGARLSEAANWAASAVASAPTLATQGTVRALWATRDMTRAQALAQAYAFIGLGTNQQSIREGQEMFASGKRIEPRIR
jgi:enoyl-CoA hydratase/carnithine racemase